jgi:hypothetical protein
MHSTPLLLLRVLFQELVQARLVSEAPNLPIVHLAPPESLLQHNILDTLLLLLRTDELFASHQFLANPLGHLLDMLQALQCVQLNDSLNLCIPLLSALALGTRQHRSLETAQPRRRKLLLHRPAQISIRRALLHPSPQTPVQPRAHLRLHALQVPRRESAVHLPVHFRRLGRDGRELEFRPRLDQPFERHHAVGVEHPSPHPLLAQPPAPAVAGRAGEDEGVLQQADVVGDLAGADHGFLLLFLRAADGGLRRLLHLAAHHAAVRGGAGEGAFGGWCPLAGCCGGGVTEGDVARALLAETLC